MADSDNISSALQHAAKRHGYKELKPAQEEALKNFLLGKDVFVSLPTGYGKSVVYELASSSVDFLASTDPAPSASDRPTPALALVISPLVSLMEDQKMRLQSRGIKTVYFSGQDDDISISNETSVILASPETMLGANGRKLMRRHGERVCGLFVDESHCISLW